MSRCLVAILSLVIVGLTANADDAKPLPRGLPPGPLPVPPRFAKIAKVAPKSRELILEEIVTKQVPYTVSAERQKDGITTTVQETRYKPVSEIVQRKFNLEIGKVYDGANKIVKPADLWSKVEVGRMVMVSSDGKRVHSTYRQKLKKEALIFVMPEPSGLPPG